MARSNLLLNQSDAGGCALVCDTLNVPYSLCMATLLHTQTMCDDRARQWFVVRNGFSFWLEFVFVLPMDEFGRIQIEKSCHRKRLASLRMEILIVSARRN